MRTLAQWLRQARFHRLWIQAFTAVLIPVAVAGVSALGRGDRQLAGNGPQPTGQTQTTTQPHPPFRAGATLVRVDVFLTKVFGSRRSSWGIWPLISTALPWASADALMAPLAPGDYAIRTTIERGATAQHILTAFRIVS